MPVARDSQAPSALCDRAEPLLRPGRDNGALERMPDALRTLGRTFPRADGGRDRRPVGEDDRDGRAVGLRRGQEGQGAGSGT